ncbi:MAG: HPF/RaiA family ribosome-associated protein [Vicinamibacterales bacterium]
MRIEVVSEGAISQQARAYAEYRVFAALAPYSEAEKVQHVSVFLRPITIVAECESVACTVTVALERSNTLHIQTTGPHAYAAINRAVDRIRTARPSEE